MLCESATFNIINCRILILKERGILFRHQQKFHQDGGIQCSTVDGIVYKSPLTMSDIVTGILIGVAGGCLSVAILVVENELHKSVKARLELT